MLYKKNSEKLLSKSLFENPTAEYRGTPFWAWNCDLNEELLEKQIGYLKEMGFGGFHMHSRCGMSLPYLGEEFMNKVKFCKDKAKENDMLAWLYDEDRWPSGAAGGYVTKDKKFRKKFMMFHRSPDAVNTTLSREEGTERAEPYFAVAYDVIFDENECLKSFKRIGRYDKPEGIGFYGFVCCPRNNEGWFNGQTYVDTLDEEAIKTFIDITYEAYKKSVGDEFDKTVPAIFTDEPNYNSIEVPQTPIQDRYFVIPWTRFMPEKYNEAYGADIFDDIPEVIWNLPCGKLSEKRYRFHNLCAELFASNFADQCGKWCDEHGIAFTGHVLAEPFLESQTNAVGECMRSYRAFQLPGIDMLCNRVELTTAKQAQSAVHQFGKEGVLSELYGVTNWTFDFKGHKYQGDWQAALGISVRVPHLAWVSMEGKAKRDYPASINYQSPWYKEYPLIENHFARLNTALTRGKPVVKVGVIHPVESMWLSKGPASQTQSIRASLESNFANITSWLIEGHYDFDYVCESLIPSQRSEDGKKLGVMEYSVIIVPALLTIRKTTIKFLEDFKKAGGTVIFLGNCPEYVDAKPCGCVKSLYENSVDIPFSRPVLYEALKAFAEVEITSGGINAERYMYNMREDGSDKWLFVANRFAPETGCWVNGQGDTLCSCNMEITINGEYYPVVYDTLSGKTYKYPFTHQNGKTRITNLMYASDSMLIKYCSDKAEYDAEPENEKTEIKVKEQYSILKKVKYTRHEPNVVLLDIASLALDDGEFDEPDEILRGYVKLSKKAFDMDMNELNKQPWVLPDEEPSHVANIKFTFNSEIEVEGAVLALEKADISEIFLNGKKVTAKPEGYYVDESIGKVALPKIQKGENEILVKTPISPRTFIEAMYLLGEFNVKLEGVTSTLTAKTEEIGFGDISLQGMPFYGGNIDYTFDIDLKETSGVHLHAARFAAPLLSIAVDGNTVGKIAFDPHDVILKDMPAGKHTVTVTCFGNRNNTFGALHWAAKNADWYGPDAWLKGGDNWTYEYNISKAGLLSSPVITLF